MRIKSSVLPAHGSKFFRRDQTTACTGKADQFRHAHTAIEVRDGADDGRALGLRLGKPDGILKLTIRNINSGFHTAKLIQCGRLVNKISNLLCLEQESWRYLHDVGQESNIRKITKITINECSTREYWSNIGQNQGKFSNNQYN